MTIAIIGRLAQIAFKNRNVIYKVLTAQDRVVGSAFRRGGYSKATQYGARHGALAGSIIGTVISSTADDSPGNGIQKPFTKQQPITSRKPYKARNRFARRYRPRCEFRPSNRSRY